MSQRLGSKEGARWATKVNSRPVWAFLGDHGSSSPEPGPQAFLSRNMMVEIFTNPIQFNILKNPAAIAGRAETLKNGLSRPGRRNWTRLAPPIQVLFERLGRPDHLAGSLAPESWR